MKIYFDNVEDIDAPNCQFLSKNDDINFWLTAPGTRLKRELKQLNIPYYDINYMDEPGLYFVEVNGDPIWWTGLCQYENGPPHIIRQLPERIVKLVRKKKLRLIISADREGGGMIFNDRNGFAVTHSTMLEKKFPPGSVLILQGNKKIHQQYEAWLTRTKNDKLFEVQYSNHFDKIFINDDLPSEPIIYESLKTENPKAFNSLNRTYKVHRSAHMYRLTVSDMLKDGLVSCNEMNFKDEQPLHLIGTITNLTHNSMKQQLVSDYDAVVKQNFPLHVDGDWSINNAANSVNHSILKNSLMSFVTETKFDEDVIFLTEKVFKCLAFGHPMIVLGPYGTIRALEELGYRLNLCGLNPNYNDIKDHTARFHATHDTLKSWLKFSYEEKIERIKTSLPEIEHNFKLAASKNLYHEVIVDLINRSKEYFNE